MATQRMDEARTGRSRIPRAMSETVRIAPEVAEALASGGPVVALESTLIAHGLPRGRNLEVARELESAVRGEGAVPATIAVVDGVRRIGLDHGRLDLAPGRPRGRPRVRHGRPRRRAPRGPRELGRVGRPDHARG